MKNHIKNILLSIVLSIAILGCTENSKDDTKVRRFTFSVPPGIVANDIEVEELAIVVFEIKEKGYLIIDAPSNYNYSKILTLIKEKNRKLHNVLEKRFPLERIYKMNQQKEYKALDGQLIRLYPETKRYVLTLEIVNDEKLREEYKSVHGIGKAWPEITNNMKLMGIKDMELYLDGFQAYLIMDTRKDFDMSRDGEKWSKLPRETEWQQYVAKFQKVDPESKAIEKWQTMILKK